MKSNTVLALESIINAGWNVTSSGDVESPTGHFAIVERPTNPVELAQIIESLEDAEQAQAFTALPTGFYAVITDTRGNVTYSQALTEPTAMRWFRQSEHMYSNWLEPEDTTVATDSPLYRVAYLIVSPTATSAITYTTAETDDHAQLANMLAIQHGHSIQILSTRRA